MKTFPKEEYNVQFFKEEDYKRKLCPKCGGYFWTQDSEQKNCGEALPEGCAHYSFINKPPTRGPFSLQQMREAFLSFFEKREHSKIDPYPVVARWRDDIYLTHASIIDFQPYVTEGIADPPANPLVIVQPCIRMTDMANTGPTFGRHLTIFEMGGHHAFNYPDKEVYWKDQTVRYHHEFLTNELGVKSEEVIYKEDIWVGGGNAGPDLECIVRGLEVDTLVFMQYKVVNGEFLKLPIRTVDTGYGIDRYAWLSQGVPSCFHTVYSGLLEKIFKIAGVLNIDNTLLTRIAEYSGLINLDKNVNRLTARRKIAAITGIKIDELDNFLLPIENVFVIADHTKCLSFLLSEGVVPSNIQEGYLARLLFRRMYRLLETLGITDNLFEIMSMQIDFWSKDYPHLKVMQNEIMEVISIEEKKFLETISRGKGLVKRIVDDLKERKIQVMPTQTMIELYDSHGLPPEIVSKFVENEGVIMDVPENFYALIAQRHETPEKQKQTEQKPAFEEKITDFPETEELFYEDQYMRQFEAKVLGIMNNDYVILDRTCFYPEGGGQPSDIGQLVFNSNETAVINVQRQHKVIAHQLKGKIPKVGTIIKGFIDWDRRYNLMKNHTATHIINGAARRVLGQHVWQSGTEKRVDRSRLNISHPRRLKLEEIHKIETLANEVVSQNIPIETFWMARSKAESLYGFRLYQGGAIPGKEIRIVKSGDWEVEACGGTHVKNSGEIGFIKIIHSERVQDGVERLDYSVGSKSLETIQENEQLLWRLSEILNSPIEKLDKTSEKIVRRLKDVLSEKKKLIKKLALQEGTTLDEKIGEQVELIEGIKVLTRDFQDLIEVNHMIQTAKETIRRDGTCVTIFYGKDEEKAHIVVMAGKKALENGVDAREITQEAASIIKGGGGGKTEFAQAGGPASDKLPKAIKKAQEVLKKQLEQNTEK
ncbi:MAG: alanine--tRNA ligase [Candidatus Bathyarchaeota archaeon]